MDNGYTLIVCEKPDAARRISDALSGGTFRSEPVEGTAVFRFVRGGEDFAVCSVRGHVYGVSDPSDERSVYPVFDVEWYPSDHLDKASAGAAGSISAIRKLATRATGFVNACDFDVEGETIGYNVLRYACGGKERGAFRAKFSTLTREDLVKAFRDLEPWGEGLARAGRARHAVDFVWGVNLSRALSQAALGFGHRYRTVSVGRVQGPTLGFVAQREREIREFVPVPYWRIWGTFVRGGKRLTAGYARNKVDSKAEAENVRESCVGKEAVVESVAKRSVQVGPPAPFNTGDLQKEAYRAFGYAPSRTLQIAEKLYLGALISYPRTESQKLPLSIDFRGILTGIGGIAEYAAVVAEILGANPRPVYGAKADPAHPAIHPTGERPRRALSPAEASVFDLVVRRFLAAFGPSAKRELGDITLAVGENKFVQSGGRTVFPGWMRYYGRYAGHRDVGLPEVSKGERFMVAEMVAEEKFEQKPPRYNQSNLLEKMEKERIGTKATRAEVIATLIERGYVANEEMEATDLGLSVVETMARYAPSIISTGLTRDIETKLEAVEAGEEGESELLRETVRTLAVQLAELGVNEEEVGKEIDSAFEGASARAFVLGRCPRCKTGELKVVRSKATKKRFAGCSNYPKCRASAPLPQRGTIRATSKQCVHCHWPVIYVVGTSRPWRLCVNPSCPGKRKP